ncbi:NDR1/HIN1-like protein 13 [Linum perenne]
MSRHHETNPHFVRPQEQPPRGSDRDRDRGRRSSPPPPLPARSGSSRDRDRDRDHGRRSSPPTHSGSGLPNHQPEAPHRNRRERDRRSTPPRTPIPIGIAGRRPEDAPPHHDEEHFPIHNQPPHHDVELGQRPKPLGPDRPKEHGHFQSPWAIPPPRPAHRPTHDGHYQSPWIPPPSTAHPADDRPLVTDPHRHDTAEQPHPQPPQPPGKHPRHHRDGRKHNRPTPPPPPSAAPGHDPSSDHHRHRRGRGPVVPSPRKTKISTWFAAVCCAIFWIAIFLAGIIILVVYLIYRPHNPRFEVSDATLNTAYLDAGSFLNADVSLLANFTNPNKKVGVDFGNLIVDLYYGPTLIATQFIQPFSAEKAGSRFVNLELVTSQVRIPLEESKKLEEQISNNTVTFKVKGVFRVRSQLGSFLAYSYKLYGHCTIVLTGPPSGVLRGRRCVTKR